MKRGGINVKKEIKELPLNKLSFKMGITMLILAIIMEIIKGSVSYDNAIQMMMIYYVMMAIIYLFGVAVLIILAVNISEAANIHRGYYIYSIVSTLILAFLWLPNFNVLLSFGELSTLSNSPSLDGVLGAGMSIYRGISDVGNLNTIMYVFFVNGIIHWIIGYFVSPQPHQQKSVNMSNINTTIQRPRFDGIKGREKDGKISIDIKVLYQCMNEKGIINRLDSKYWIYDVETFIRKENEINKKYLKIKFFNRFFNSEDDLMRIYLKINGEEIYEDFIQNIPEYDDDNIKGIIIERDLAEEIFEVEITGYIVNGSRENVNGKSISNIKLNSNEKLLSAIKERFFTDNKEKCKTIPAIMEDYWLCTCGFVNESEYGACQKCGSQKELIEEISHFKEEDLLNNISELIAINTKQTVEEIIDDISKRYYEEYGIPQEMTYEAIDKEILKRRQEELIDEEIERMFENRPIKFISGLSYSDNIEAYCRKNAHGIINADMIEERINDGEWQQLYEENERKQKSQLKRNKKKVLLFSLILVALIIVFIGYKNIFESNDTNIQENEQIEEFTIEQSEYYMNVGDIEKINLTQHFGYLNFEVEDESIIDISNDGIMTALDTGETTVHVIGNETGKSEDIFIYVKNKDIDWQQKYIEYFNDKTIADLYEYEPDDSDKTDIIYQLIDLDNNDIPEIIIYDEGFEGVQIGMGHIFSINDNSDVYKVTELALSYATYKYDSQTEHYYIDDYTRLSDQSNNNIYDGVHLIKSFSFGKIDENISYYIDNMTVSKDTYDIEMKKYTFENSIQELQYDGISVYDTVYRDESISLIEELMKQYNYSLKHEYYFEYLRTVLLEKGKYDNFDNIGMMIDSEDDEQITIALYDSTPTASAIYGHYQINKKDKSIIDTVFNEKII